MADTTTEIAGLEDGAAPISYTVPAALIFDLLGVRAVFDGSGAAGDFLPACQIISDAGHLLSQTVGSAVTAGDSADVTFAPFLRGRDGIQEITSVDASVTVTDPFGPITDLSTAGGGGYTPPTTNETIRAGSTTVTAGGNKDASFAYQSGTNGLVSLATPTHPASQTSGIYAVEVFCELQTLLAANDSIRVDFYSATGASNQLLLSKFWICQVFGDALQDSLSACFYCPATTYWRVNYVSGASVSATLVTTMTIQRVT